MKDLYIVGAGGCGREVLQIVKDVNKFQGPKWNIIGFLDDTEDPLAGKDCDYKVVGTIQNYIPKDNDALVMAIASPQAKQKLVPMLADRGAVFETVIHPNASISEFSTIGVGTVIYQNAIVSCNVRVGNFVTLLACGLGHDTEVGHYSTISSYCNIMGGVKIGERVFIAGNCAVIPHITIENDAYIGVGSVVLHRVRTGTRVFGNPAHPIDF